MLSKKVGGEILWSEKKRVSVFKRYRDSNDPIKYVQTKMNHRLKYKKGVGLTCGHLLTSLMLI